MEKLSSYYKSQNNDLTLLHGDCVKLLGQFEFQFDMIFADPPYFLSNGGISVSNGRKVCVDKGEWDKSETIEYITEFNRKWISACRDKLKDNGTIWISGTHHNIFSVANALSEFGFKILNVVTWAKTNPPDNLSHRMFRHSSEFIIWAKKSKKAQHQYNYDIMLQFNAGKQMTDVWYMPAVQKWEKLCGKHPTQKPLALLARIILASTKEGDWVLDPFNGSGTTGIASSLLNRRYLGIDKNELFLEISERRRVEINDENKRRIYQEKILAGCRAAEINKNKKYVLVGRVGTLEQWQWINTSLKYNLPFSKVFSTPKLLSVEYVLVFQKYNVQNAHLYHVGKFVPQIKTKEQIQKMANNKYTPKRDELYWLFHLKECKDVVIDGKLFDRRTLIPNVSNRGAYWILELEEVLNSFKELIH